MCIYLYRVFNTFIYFFIGLTHNLGAKLREKNEHSVRLAV
jgi:hypothetical protein